MNLETSVDQYMSANPVTLKGSQTLAEAKRLFVENGFTLAPIVDGAGRLMGVVSDADVIAGDQGDALLTEVMTRAVVTVDISASVADVARLLTDAGVHHLVVIGKGRKPVGVVSVLDIATAVAESGSNNPASWVMTEELVQIPVDTLASAARELLEEAEITAAAVVSDTGEVVGALSREALLREEGDPDEDRVDQIMMTPVLVVPKNEPISNIAQLFVEERARRIFVVDDDSGEVLGIVTPTDLVRYAAGVSELTDEL